MMLLRGLCGRSGQDVEKRVIWSLTVGAGEKEPFASNTPRLETVRALRVSPRARTACPRRP